MGKRTSPRGCHNCRFRRIRCGEARPQCAQCSRYGIVCSYVSGQSTQDISLFGARESLMMVKAPVSDRDVVESIYPPIPIALRFWPTRTDELMQKFQLLTASTITMEPKTYLYQTVMVEKARLYPFLRFALLGLTAMHLSWLNADKSANLTVEAINYCLKAITSFAKEILQPRDPEHQAILLCTSGLIYNMSFAAVEASTPEQVWPMAPASKSDLGWIQTLDAKSAVSQLAVPVGHHPLFSTLSSYSPALEVSTTYTPLPPLGFVTVFGIDSQNRSSKNPYFESAMDFLKIYTSQDTITISSAFTVWLGGLSQGFKNLLQEKDARALVLLACWYAKVSERGVWWYRRRCLLEGRSICMYLRRYHAQDLGLQVLLRWPSALFDNQVIRSWTASEFGLV